VITNQQGVGKGLMAPDDLKKIHEFLLQEVEKYGGKIDAIYYCTDLKNAQNNCRKPGLWMAEQAKADFPEVDFSESIMIGDTKTDLEFAINANMMSVLLLTEYSTEQEISLADNCIFSLTELSNQLN
jgi:histidinol-phosphate phosphatase family protein